MIDVVWKQFFGAYLQRHTSRGNHSPVSAFRETLVKAITACSHSAFVGYAFVQG